MDKEREELSQSEIKRALTQLRKIMKFNEMYGLGNFSNPSSAFMLYATPYPEVVSKGIDTFPQGIILSGNSEQLRKSRAWAEIVCPFCIILETKVEDIEKRHPLRLIINKT
jgi:hypothetical protein